MSIIAWIVLGLIAQFVASQIVNRESEGIFLDIVLGIVGALVGGFIFNAFGAAGVTRFNCGAYWWQYTAQSSYYSSIMHCFGAGRRYDPTLRGGCSERRTD